MIIMRFFFLFLFIKTYVVGTHLNLKTTAFLDCALIGVCAVIRSNTVYASRKHGDFP